MNEEIERAEIACAVYGDVMKTQQEANGGCYYEPSYRRLQSWITSRNIVTIVRTVECKKRSLLDMILDFEF